MPHIPTDPNRREWKYGPTFIGKVVKPGCKPVIQGNGRVSLRFAIRIPCGVPFENVPSKWPHKEFLIRCIWFDPDFMLETSDVVEVAGVLTWSGKDLALCVNRAQVIARFIKSKAAGPSKQPPR